MDRKLKLAHYAGITILASLSATSTATAQILNVGSDLTEVMITEPSTSIANIDFQNAQAMPLPMLQSLPNIPPGAELPGGFSSQEHGVYHPTADPMQKPYNTKRVATKSSGTPATQQPYAAAGKLYFNIDDNSYVCSASLIKTGIVITAAHCVAQFGGSKFYTDFVFVPGKHFGAEPYGQWTAQSVVLKTVYYNGSDDCYAAGVVCRNDVAVIRLAAKTDDDGEDYYAGDSNMAGRFGFAVNNNGFNQFKEALITQLGYPVSHDSGLAMHENNSQSTQRAAFVDNNVISSRMTGGSSGGPWIINHGYKGSLSTPVGNSAGRNLVVGVTSWGYTSSSYKIQGASRLTTSNGQGLINYYGCGTGSTLRHCVD